MSQEEKDFKGNDQIDSAATENANNGTNSAYANTLPPIDFSSFVLSLSHAAMMHLGQIPDPATGKVNADIGFARHTIDTIAMLKEKTAGNLNPDEQQLIDNILTELRLVFVRSNK